MSEPSSPKVLFDRKQWILPALLFLVAVLIRLPGLTWGLKDDQHNQSFHPDEELNYRVSRRIEPTHLKFTPDFYRYGTVYFTALRIAGDIAYGYGGGSDHPDSDWDYIRRGELAGRVITALSGALLCVTAYFLCLRFAGQLGAAASSLVLAVAPGLVVHSRFATVDVLATLFVALSGLYAIRLLLDEDPPWLKVAVLAGVFAGLSAGTKYTGALALLMPIAAIWLRRPPKPLQLTLASAVACVLTFIVSTPGCLLQSDVFLHDVQDEMKHTATGHGMVFTGTSSGFIFHLSNLCLGVGIILTFLGVGSLLWAATKKQHWALVLLAFALPYYVLIGRAEVKFMRYVFPLTVSVAAGVGYAVNEGQRRGKGGRALVALGILGIGGLDAGGLRGAWFFTSAMLAPDSRELVKPRVLAAPHPSGDVTVGLITDPWFWSPTLYPDITVGMVSPETKQRLMNSSQDPHVVRYVPIDGSPAVNYDSRLITESKPDYVTYSDFESLYVERVARLGIAIENLPPDQAADVDRYKQFRSALQSAYVLDAQYGNSGDMVEDMRYVMPTVYVWKRKP